MNKLLIAPTVVATAVFGAILFVSGRIASGEGPKLEKSAIEITDADSLLRDVGKSVSFTGFTQQRRSGPWLRRGPMAVQILGIQKWPEDLRTGPVAVTGTLAKRSGHEQGNEWFAIDAKDVAPVKQPPLNSTRPATMPSDEIISVTTQRDLVRHNCDHVRVRGILINALAGPHLYCGEFSVQLLIKGQNAELRKALYSDTPVWIEADGWVRDLHYRNPLDGKKIKPGTGVPQSIASGDWYAIDDVEWTIVPPPHDRR